MMKTGNAIPETSITDAMIFVRVRMTLPSSQSRIGGPNLG
jgi:hypothetical protein